MNPYEVLGVDPAATPEEVRVAFRRFVGSHHPDRGGDPEAFRAGVWAYRQLLGGPRTSAGEVVFFRKPRGVQILVHWWQLRRRPPRVL